MIRLENVCKNFGDLQVLKNVNLEVKEGEKLVIIGPSGSGKSTLAKAILGMLDQYEGEIIHHSKRPQMVFQDPYSALNPSRSVRWILEEPLKIYGKYDAKERRRRVIEMLERVGLSEEYLERKPGQLSGGQQQRVGIARAYCNEPKLMLMDEPFGALDAQTRTQLQTELLKTWESERKTCFFITHDVDEAIILAQRVIVMSARPGRIKDIVDIDIPYPRDQETKMSPRFMELKNHIWSQVYQEYLEVRK